MKMKTIATPDMLPLESFITEYKDINMGNKYRPVAVGKYGIRTRESIYSKELAKDYSKNKLIYKDTLTVGMGSVQIDIGVLSDDVIYSVSPAYHTYKIKGINSLYLRYCLQCRNSDMFNRFAKRGSRQGKTIDLKRWLKYEIPVYDIKTQEEIVYRLEKVLNLIELRKHQLQQLDELVKSRFVEMFGDPKDNLKGYTKKQLKDTCRVITGNTPSRAIREYYGNHIEWIKTDNIVPGQMIPSKAIEGLSILGRDVGRVVEPGSILMACIAGSVSSIGRICITDRPVAFNQQINAIIPRDYNVYFLYTLLQLSKSYLVEEINMALKGILSKSKLENKAFIIPPREMQDQFGSFVLEIDKSKSVIPKALDETQLLFDSLMQEYFG